VLVIMDSDDSCPKELAHLVLARAERAAADRAAGWCCARQP
jgi:hypothetical protein